MRALCLSVLSVQLWAQAPANADAKANAAAATGTSANELTELKQRIAQQEEAIKKLQEALNQQRTMLDQAVKTEQEKTQTASVANNAQVVPVSDVRLARASAQQPDQQPKPLPSPLGIQIGNSTFTPFGFVDATYFWRSTTAGSGIGTNFAGIPLNTAANGHLSENNLSAQNSRIGVRVDSKMMGWQMLGYLEADFLFNNNSNSFQAGSNSAGMRLRNYFVDANNGKFEFLGGQDWSMMTPNRKGLSPIPSDIFYTQNMDTNYQVGLVWTRAPQFRFVWHPSKAVAWGFAIENPQQYIGGVNGSGVITLPTNLLNTTIGGQFQSGAATLGSVNGAPVATTNQVTNVPNLTPDFQTKIAFDGTPGGHAAHLEVGGMLRTFKDYILPNTAGAIAGSHTATGGALEVNSNFELFKNFRLVENIYYSDGGGRYLFASAPDVALRPNGSLSLVHADGTVDGFEAQVSKNTLLAAYYGGMYVNRDAITNVNGAVNAGYGFPGSSATQNRYVQELTFDWVQTLWKNKNYGALSLINQYSYVFREPWSVTGAGPKQAHSNMVYIDVRYTLP